MICTTTSTSAALALKTRAFISFQISQARRLTLSMHCWLGYPPTTRKNIARQIGERINAGDLCSKDRTSQMLTKLKTGRWKGGGSEFIIYLPLTPSNIKVYMHRCMLCILNESVYCHHLEKHCKAIRHEVESRVFSF